MKESVPDSDLMMSMYNVCVRGASFTVTPVETSDSANVRGDVRQENRNRPKQAFKFSEKHLSDRSEKSKMRGSGC